MYNKQYTFYMKITCFTKDSLDFKQAILLTMPSWKWLIKYTTHLVKINSHLVSLDLSKGFDTVDKDLLLPKLKFHDIHNMKNHKWFTSYFTSRKQFIEYDKTKTKTNSITCGIPRINFGATVVSHIL